MSGSEYWNLHLIVTNRNSVSRQNKSVAGIRCCNNFLLLWLLNILNELRLSGVNLQSGPTRLFGSSPDILAYTPFLPCRAKWSKSTFFLYFHIEKKINDKSLPFVFVCMTKLVFLFSWISFSISSFNFSKMARYAFLTFDGLSYASVAK